MFTTNLVLAFLEKVYENAMFIELRRIGLSCHKTTVYQGLL